MKQKKHSTEEIIRILLEDEGQRRDIQRRFEFIHVDEFQDLNIAQLLFVELLSMPHNNQFLVGDDDQMIYGWRGAKVSHLIDFPKRYPYGKTFVLSTNYCSTKKVVRLSGYLI